MIVTFLKHGSNALIVALLAGCVAVTAVGLVSFVPLAFLAGLVIFGVSEYTTHRFALHAKPQSSRLILNLQHRLHYDHHTDPADLDLLFLPMWFVVPVFAGYGLIYLGLTRSLAAAVGLLAGNLLALLWYEWVHYVAHIPFAPKTAFGRWIKKYHLLHHFKNEHFWFGVTNPLVDVFGGTYRGVTDVERSATTRNLY